MGLFKIMKKKQYIAPEVEIAEIEMVSMLAASKFNGSVSDEETEDDAWMSNDRRGSWGNLWDNK